MFIQYNLFAMNHEINRELFKKDNIHTQFARDIVNVFKGNLIQLFFFNLPTVFTLSFYIGAFFYVAHYVGRRLLITSEVNWVKYF